MKMRLLVCFFPAFSFPALAASCSGVSAAAIAFGNYTGMTVSPAGSTISATCTLAAITTIMLDAGTGSGATESIRKMTSNGSTLSYGLYQDAGLSLNWGNSLQTGYVSVIGTGLFQTRTIYPTLTSGQNVPPGTYTDTMTMTITVPGGTTQKVTFDVTAVVQKSCALAASPLAFGNYATANVSASSVISLTCTLMTTFTLALGVGTGSGATVTNRLMTKGPYTLPYSLWQDASFQTPWGDTTGTSEAGTGTGTTQNLTVFGEILAGHFVSPGAYADTISATITY